MNSKNTTLPSYGELILYMSKDIAILAILAHLGGNKHKDETMQALYEIEYLRSKQKTMDSVEDPMLQQEIVAALKKEGFIGL